MKAKDLRIGNIVQNQYDMVITVHAILPLEVKGKASEQITNLCIWNRDLRGIVISEEWFLKFGFKLFNGCYWIKNRFELTEEEPGHWERSTGFGGYREDGVSIQYVHQLQNLYFAITGEELTISSKT